MNPCSHYKQNRCFLHGGICFDDEDDDCLGYSPVPDPRLVDKRHQAEVERMETYGIAAKLKKDLTP